MGLGRLRALRTLGMVLSATVVSGGCTGGCETLRPLPAGGLPADQTVEGGVQVRVTRTGFEKISGLVPQFLETFMADGLCLPEQGPWNFLYVADVYACDAPACAGGALGCQVNLTLNEGDTSVSIDSVNNRLRVESTYDLAVSAPVTAYWLVGDPGTCTFDVTVNDGHIAVDFALGIDAATGQLTVHLAGVPSLDLSGLAVDSADCAILGTILGGVVGLFGDALSSAIANWAIDALAPAIDGFLQGLIPQPLGLEGIVDLGGLVGPVIPGVAGDLEVKAVAGGYASLVSEGLSVGLIVGINSDVDPATRTDDLDNEPARCVPMRPAPDFSAPPASLDPVPARGTFALEPADPFLAIPEDPATDVAFGISETVLDLGGFHAVNSGALCASAGSDLVPQLNVGTIGLLVPSLSRLSSGSGKEPLLLSLRPQQPLDFSIGEGTTESPRLTVHLREMEVDFYAFLFERYVRAFTLSLTADVGINLDFTLTDEGLPAILPTFVGLDAESITMTVTNAEFLAEDAAVLEAVFPSLLDLVVPLLSQGLGAIPLPQVYGFGLEYLQVHKVSTPQDDFLAIYATLLAQSGKRPTVPSVETSARLVRVASPGVEEVRAALAGRGGALPEIELALGATVDGRPAVDGAPPVEWQWSLDGGMWRPYAPSARLVLRSPGLALPGRHVVRVRARVAGDYRAFDRTPVELPFVLDPEAPRLTSARAVVVAGELRFAAHDLVTPADRLEFSFAPLDRPADATPFARGGGLAVADAERLAGGTGRIAVTVRDEAGNVARGVGDVTGPLFFHGRLPPGEPACTCRVGTPGGRSAVGPLALFAAAVLPLALRRPRRRRRALAAVALGALAGLATGCNCSSTPGTNPECTVHDDCADVCTGVTVPMCLTGECFCADDIPRGRVGAHSDVAAAPDGRIWVSGYNETHGDLMVAMAEGPGRIPVEGWQFVDGVPDGPVVLPTSDVRGGVREAGDDVGRFTSIVTTAAGDPLVAYYDATHGSLRFAARLGGEWRRMDADRGTLGAGEGDATDAGRYASLALGADGAPAIAYFATVTGADGASRAQLRLARALTTEPGVPEDWQVAVLDEVELAPLPEGAEPPADLPRGLGLFPSLALRSDGTFVVAYYDRERGALKASGFDPATSSPLPARILQDAETLDIGRSPSVAVVGDEVHVAYVEPTRARLLHLQLEGGAPPDIVDDGLRSDGTTSDGVPRPVFHRVGDDAGLVAAGGALAVAYQDATSHELLLARQAGDGVWSIQSLAGEIDEEHPYVGAYGFFAAAAADGGYAVISTWALNLRENDAWVEVYRVQINIE